MIGKRLLYTLCFVALFVIDWMRGSQAGAIWAWAVNMTGVIIAIILFSSYPLKEFKKPIYLLYSVIGILAIVMAYYWWNLNQTVIFRDQLLTAVLNIWLLGIHVIKMFLDVAVYKTKKLYYCKTEIIAMAMLLWMLFSINEDIWPGWYLVMFGLFYHTEYKGADMGAMKDGMLDGIIASFFLLQGAAFVFRPYDTIRYRGIYNNSNMNALFYGIVWITFIIRLYDIRKKKDKKWKECICFLFAGALMGFGLITGCRTLLLAMGMTGIFYIVLADFYGLREKAKVFLKKLVLYVVTVCASIPVVYAAARYIPPIFHHPIWYDGEYSIERVHSFDPWNSEKYTSWDDCLKMMAGRLEPVMKIFFSREEVGLLTVQAVEPGSEGRESQIAVNSIQERIDIWEFYIQNGNLKGHINEDGHDHPAFSRRYIWHAQNTFVQFWYYYGIPAAIFLAAVSVLIVIISIKKIKDGQEEATICLLYYVFWMMYGLTECVWYPGQMVLLLVFFTQKFLFQKEQRIRKIS